MMTCRVGRWGQRRNCAAGPALRARIVAACADGGSNVEAADHLELDRNTFSKSRNRFAAKRLAYQSALAVARPMVLFLKRPGGQSQDRARLRLAQLHHRRIAS